MYPNRTDDGRDSVNNGVSVDHLGVVVGGFLRSVAGHTVGEGDGIAEDRKWVASGRHLLSVSTSWD
jgi:hypothetical protein